MPAENLDSEAEESIPAWVTMISGCRDEQTSADVGNAGKVFELPVDSGPGGAGGACTTAMVSVLSDSSESKGITWAQLLGKMRQVLEEKGYSQVPQLSSSRRMSIQQPFRFSGPRLENDMGCARALLIGINYVGQKGELGGCHNDIETMRRLLLDRGWPAVEMRILLDDGQHPTPTRAGILEGFQWLTENAAAGDARFLHYSGHGGSKMDWSGDEKDRRDETLCPVDYKEAGQITDDTIFEELISKMPRGVSLSCVMDCCHSGTILDLPFKLKADQQTMEAVESGQVQGLEPNLQFSPEKANQILNIAQVQYAAYASGKQGGGKTLCMCLLSSLKILGTKGQAKKEAQGQKPFMPLTTE